MTTSMVDRLLIADMPIEIHMRLAVAIGVESACIVQRLHLRLKGREIPKEVDGVKWYPAGPDTWEKELPCFTKEHFAKLMIHLIKKKVIVARNDLNKEPGDPTPWITIDYRRLDEVSSS